MKRFFKIEQPGVLSSWSSKLIGVVFPLVKDDEYFVEIQVGSVILPINKKLGSIVTEDKLSHDQNYILSTINYDV